MSRAKAKTDVPAEVVEGFAAEWAGFRLGGLPSGFYDDFRKRVEKAGRKHGRSFSEVWPLVHKAAYAIIDADERSRLLTTKD